MITSLLRQNDIATTFWINYDVIIMSCVRWEDLCSMIPDSKVHGANMEPNWVLSASNGPHVGSMNLAIRVFETIYDHIHCDDNKSDFLLSTVLANILASFETKCQDICGYGLFMDHAVKIKICKNANTWSVVRDASIMPAWAIIVMLRPMRSVKALNVWGPSYPG